MTRYHLLRATMLCIVYSVPLMSQGLWNDEEVEAIFPNRARFVNNFVRLEDLVAQNSLEISKFNISTLKKLNSIKTKDEFARFFGLSTPPLPSLRAGVVGDDSMDALTKETVPVAENVGCTPVKTIVHLTPKPDNSVAYFPTCVYLDRCGGCCYGTLLSCQPETTEKTKLSVMKIKQGVSTRAGRVRNNTTVKQEFETVEEVIHKTCACKCVLQAKDCNPDTQVYDSNECSCQCKDKSGQSNCEIDGDSHYWDPKKCFCFCRKVMECSTGTSFDHKSCKCVGPSLSAPLRVAVSEAPHLNRLFFECWALVLIASTSTFLMDKT